ncbi:MAG: hypothetical protein SVY10_09850 [Thermodesulfobacteriota bacterium]|nr:hypothetical protein [Thermodesulfobacteriota bacterium]
MKRKTVVRLMRSCVLGVLLTLLSGFTFFAEAKPSIKHFYIIDLTGPYGVLVPEIFEGTQDY